VGNKFWWLTLATILLLEVGCVSTPPRRTNTFARVLASTPAPETQKLTKLMWPVARKNVSQEFKPEEDYSRPHDGIDISAPRGTRIYAPADGVVVYSGQRFKGYGKMIIIEHGPRLATIYGHLHRLLVKQGERVRRGSLIGLVGRTGRASAPHLHFEVRLNKEPVDPLGYLP
jgi:murein DD-endopeptidase MepM/ murein hydrolase activator NlpD